LRRLEKQMGGQDRSILEGKVSVDGGQAHWLVPRDRVKSSLAPMVPQGSKLYLIKVDFTLHRLVNQKICREMTLRLSLEDSGAAAVDLFPRHIDSIQVRPKSLTVTRAVQLMGVEDRSGPFPVDGLEPEVTGYREHERSLYWVFKPGAEGGAVAQGAKSVFFLLSVPEQLTTASISVGYQADIGSYLFGQLWWPGPAKSETQVVVVKLK
jgi:hypothetical protein